MPQLSLLAPQPEASRSNDLTTSTDTCKVKSEVLEFSTLVGQSTAVYLLNGGIVTNRVAPTYLFAGPEGVGKTLAARIFTSQILQSPTLNNHPDLLWVEPAYLHQGELVNKSELAGSGNHKHPPQIRIEQVREATQFLSCSPLTSPCKLVIIVDADQMAQAAANALLKTLEEPAGGTIILLSSQPQKILPTIASRCQIIPFQRLNYTAMVAVLERNGLTEILENPIVISLAAGSPGKASAYYNQLQTIPQSLLAQLSAPPTDALAAMQLAKEIDTVLEYYQQAWLLDYVQHSWWHRYHDVALVSKVEEAKAALNRMASSRLVWEVLLLSSDIK